MLHILTCNSISIMKQFSFLLLALGFLLTSANIYAQGDAAQNLDDFIKKHQIKTERTKEGIHYLIEKPGNGRKPIAGDYVKVRYKSSLLTGKVFDESPEEEPFVFRLGYRQVIQGWDLGVPLFQVGTKASLFVPPALGYGENGAGNIIPGNAPLIFELEILEIMDRKSYNQYMVALERKERRAFEAHQKKQFKTDKKIIQEYVLQNKLKTKRTDSGLSYHIAKKGRGRKAKPGDYLEVHYEGFLVDGTKFDSSLDKKPYPVTLGKGKVIPGWEEGLQHFKKGGEGWILVPSRMAYGPRAIEEDNISIPANSVLIFKVKIVDLKADTKHSTAKQ
ncbi:MAG: FKBP-type peptidyl-prolyl cis-trans isomerase [Saprospiraceae bacterium]